MGPMFCILLPGWFLGAGRRRRILLNLMLMVVLWVIQVEWGLTLRLFQ
ncbi:hypothetical protein NC651_016695 [Populus alba x Populus x berolinensis]|nr:hypothetical protein NC651_016695 [Populus alba x Populus x berolinensis]